MLFCVFIRARLLESVFLGNHNHASLSRILFKAYSRSRVMGQCWNMLNVDNRQKARGVEGKLPQFIFKGHSWVVELLARPALPSTKNVPSYYLAASADKRHELGLLSVLPPELVSIVFSHLATMDDAICFATAHRLLGHDGFRRVVRLRRREHRHLGSWFGARIITAGENTRELPKDMLTDAEDEELKNDKFGNSLGFYYFASDHYKWAAPLDLDRFGFIYNRDEKKPAMRRVSPRRGDKLRVRLLLEDTSPYYNPNAAWGLCNLNRKEYIRASAVADMKINRAPSGKVLQAGSVVEGPFVRGDNTILDLGTFAIILTEWPWTGGAPQPQSWAGECLAILEVDMLKDKKWKGKGWKDVSGWGVRLVDRWVAMNDDCLQWY